MAYFKISQTPEVIFGSEKGFYCWQNASSVKQQKMKSPKKELLLAKLYKIITKYIL